MSEYLGISVTQIGSKWFLTRSGRKKLWIVAGPFATEQIAIQKLEDLKTGDA